jgi:predicted ATPase
MVMFEAAIALAQAHSLTGPALLLIDDFGDFLHPAATRKLLAVLASASEGFQAVVVTHHCLPAEIRREWTITTIGPDDCGPVPEIIRP